MKSWNIDFRDQNKHNSLYIKISLEVYSLNYKQFKFVQVSLILFEMRQSKVTETGSQLSHFIYANLNNL